MSFVPSEYSGVIEDAEAKAAAYKALLDVQATALKYAAEQKAGAAVSTALAPAAAAAAAAEKAAETTEKVLAWLPWIGGGVLLAGGYWLWSRQKHRHNPAQEMFAEDLRASIDEPIRTAREIAAAKGIRAKAGAYRRGAGRSLERVTVGQLRRVPRLLAMFGIPT